MSLNVTVHKDIYKSKVRITLQISGVKKNIWYEIPDKFIESITESCDPYLISLIFMAMERGEDLVIEGNVSRSLLRNMDEFQLVWRKWKPKKYSKINIYANIVDVDKFRSESAISAFTGGVDSTFLLYKNLENSETIRYPIDASLFIHGFDIPRIESQRFCRTFNEVEKITESVGIPLISIRTNLREFGYWDDIHAAAIISCAALLKQKYSACLLGSSHPYSYLRFPWGSNSITDPLLSSDDFKVINFGGGFSRLEKISLLSTIEPFQKYLHICTKLYFGNCGKCEKCIRTKLCYVVNNAAIPGNFEYPHIHVKDILTILAFKTVEIKDYKTIFKRGKENGCPSALIYSLLLNIYLNSSLNYVLKITGQMAYKVSTWNRFVKKTL